jgi:predicted negative regulator of RcsB-dependent stress response
MTEKNLTQQNQPEARPVPRAKMGVFIIMIALIILLGAFGYGYFQLSQVNTTLARTLDEIKSNQIILRPD